MMYTIPEFNPPSDPHIAVAPNGDAVAVWLVTNSKIVYASKYTASTTTWGTAEQINSVSNTLSGLQIAMDNNGNAMAVWSVVQGGKTFVYARYYDNVSGWDAGGSKNIGNTTGTSTNAQVAFDASGNAIVVWLQGTDVYYNRYTGSWGLTPGMLSTAAANPPQLAVRDNGDAVAVWAQAGTSHDEINVSFYTSGGTWTTAASLGNTDWGKIPQVAVDQYGNAMVVWIQGSVSPFSLQAAYYNATSTSWETIQNLDGEAHDGYTPQIVMHHQGKGMAVWRTIPSACSPCRMRYDTFSGSTWTKKLRYADAGNSNSTFPQLAMDPAGNAMLVWREATTANPTIESAWYNRYQHGVGWGTATLLETNDSYSVSNPAVGMSNNGITFATWLQNNSTPALSTWAIPFN